MAKDTTNKKAAKPRKPTKAEQTLGIQMALDAEIDFRKKLEKEREETIEVLTKGGFPESSHNGLPGTAQAMIDIINLHFSDVDAVKKTLGLTGPIDLHREVKSLVEKYSQATLMRDHYQAKISTVKIVRISITTIINAITGVLETLKKVAADLDKQLDDTTPPRGGPVTMAELEAEIAKEQASPNGKSVLAAPEPAADGKQVPFDQQERLT